MKKPKKDERRISLSADDCHYRIHREDFETCPHCREKFDVEEWKKTAHTLILPIVNGCHEYIAIVSGCPKCFEKSWVHHHLIQVRIASEKKVFPAEWAKAAVEEITRRKQAAQKAWESGLCKSCVNLKSFEITTLAHRECESTTFSSFGCATPTCDHYKKKP